MMENENFSVVDLLKPQVPLSCLWPDILDKKFQRNTLLQEVTHEYLKDKENYNENCLNFFGINLDKENAFLDTGFFGATILSLLSKNSASLTSNTNELRQKPTVIRSPKMSPQKLLFTSDVENPEIDPKKMLKQKLLSTLKLSLEQENSPSRVSRSREDSVPETPPKTIDSSGDTLELYPSPSQFLMETQFECSTPLRSKSDKCMLSKISDEKPFDLPVALDQHTEKLIESNGQDASLLRQQSKKSLTKTVLDTKCLASSILLQKDPGKEGSPNKVPSVHTHSASEVDSNVGESGSIRDSKACIACMLNEMDSCISHNVCAPTESISSKVLTRARTESSTSKLNSNTEKNSAFEKTDEENLSESMCNISIHDSAVVVDDTNEINPSFIIIDEILDDSDVDSVQNAGSNDNCEELKKTDKVDLPPLVCSKTSSSKEETTDRKREMSSNCDVSKSVCQSLPSPKNIETKIPVKSPDASQPLFKLKNKEIDKVQTTAKDILGNEQIVTSSNKSESESLHESVKSYMLPFISSNPQENKDNEDPRWSYLAKLKTDEERYQLSRKLWKSIVVPDPNINITYNGCSRRWRAQRKTSQGTSGNLSTRRSQKRKLEQNEDNKGCPPRKRARTSLNVTFSMMRFERSMEMVALNFIDEISQYNISKEKKEKLQQAYQEKIHQLRIARLEVEAVHKFYSGLPDQKVSVSQSFVENEQLEIEHLYMKFKKFYSWNGRDFIC